MAKPAAMRDISEKVGQIHAATVERVPHHFTMKHMVGAFFGAFFFGLTFALKGLLLDATRTLTDRHITWMVVAIVVILSAEIYYIGYARVRNKSQRAFGQFWIKRIATYMLIGFLVSGMLIYLYGLDALVMGQEHLRNTIIALALPCCIGASIADLLEQY